MQLADLRRILKIETVPLRRTVADVLRRTHREDMELSQAEAALLCLADFAESFFNLAQPVNDLLRRVWDDLREHYEGDPQAWEEAYTLGLIDRRYVVWPERKTFLDLQSLEDVDELPGPPVQVHSVDVTEYFRRAQAVLAKLGVAAN